jgi:hypothetical protein
LTVSSTESWFDFRCNSDASWHRCTVPIVNCSATCNEKIRVGALNSSFLFPPCSGLFCPDQILSSTCPYRRSLWSFHALHTGARWDLSAFLKSNCTHTSTLVRVSHEVSVIFSNAKNETRPQHKHLNRLDNLKNAEINITSRGKWVLH